MKFALKRKANVAFCKYFQAQIGAVSSVTSAVHRHAVQKDQFIFISVFISL